MDLSNPMGLTMSPQGIVDPNQIRPEVTNPQTDLQNHLETVGNLSGEGATPSIGGPAGSESSVIQEKIQQLMKMENLADITLAGYLIKLLRNRIKLSYKELYDEVSKCYDTLRRSDGSKYTGDLAKALKGCLTSSEIFKEVGENVWTIREKEAKMYEEKTTKKLKALINRKKGKTVRKQASKEATHDFDDESQISSTGEPNDRGDDFSDEKVPEKVEKPERVEKIEKPIIPEKTPEKVVESKPVEMPVEEPKKVENPVKVDKPEKVEKIEKVEKVEKQDKKDKLNKKPKREKENYEQVFRMLDLCCKAIKGNDNTANLIVNPFKNLKGTETLDELWQTIGADQFIGILQCFDYFSPIIEDYLKIKPSKNGGQIALEDIKSMKTRIENISKRVVMLQEELKTNNKPAS
jgi:hypothetical protein